MKKRWFLILTLFVMVLTGCATTLPGDVNPEQRTLNSLTKVDGHPLYVMNYYGPYATASVGQNRPSNAEDKAPAWACSLFAALGDEDAMLYGRNFDWDHSPAVLLFTAPSDAYASVSMVDIAYLDFNSSELRRLDKLSLEKRRPLLNAPFLPFDGMNEHGLVVGMAAVPNSTMPNDASKTTIDSLGVIREMLDHAKTVNEAVAVMETYNIDMAGGPAIHYLIADATGAAVLVEFYEGDMVLISNETRWHQATNFLRSATDNAEGVCRRHDAIHEKLTETQGKFATQDALDLLQAVSQGNTQWSVVYGITSRDIDVVMGRTYDHVYTFKLSSARE